MKIQDRIARRKIGAFELLVGFFPFELVFGSTSRALGVGLLAVGFYFAKRAFAGEFSLLDLVGLFNDSNEPKDRKQ